MPLRILNSAYVLYRRRGFGYFWYLIWGVLVPKAIYRTIYRTDAETFRRMFRIGIGLAAVLVYLWLHTSMGWQAGLGLTSAAIALVWLVYFLAQRYELSRVRQQARNLTLKDREAYDQGAFTRWLDLNMPVETRQAIEIARAAHRDGDFVIGEIDQDGLVFGIYGPFGDMEMIGRDEFQPRLRYQLDIVLIGEYVLVRKGFGRDRTNFFREWYHLAALAGKASVPPLYRVDEANRCLYMNLIPGKTLRDRLVEAGAKIRDSQTRNDPELVNLNPASRAEKVIERSRKLAGSCFSEETLVQLERQLDLVHSCNIASLDLKYGNIVIHPADGMPWILDFENARHYRARHPLFQYKRDGDRARLNRLYCRSALTESSARAQLNELERKMPWYAPLDFGNGLTVGPFWSTDAGTGRWEYLNCPVLTPLIQDKRILDLGSNNGTMPMMMLRAGAREVIGLELSSIEVERANLVKRIFEWRDMRPYRFEIVNADMLEMLRADWGRFDIVTAFCSLYYLETEQMAQAVRRAAYIASMMVLQANASEHKNPEKSLKASVPFLKKLLEENGFPVVQIHAPENYSRPLLIGSRAGD